MSNSPNTVSTQKKWYQKVPPVFVLLLIMIFICAILTYIVPAGEFDREMLEDGSRAVVVAGSYHPVEQSPVSLLDVFKALPQGFAASASIIAMILFSAGAFQVMTESGTIENVLGVLLNKVGTGKNSGTIVIWVVTFIFSIIGIFIGPEVHVPFTVVTVAVALGMGYDLITGMAMLIGGCIGFATAPINASTIGTCDAISGLPLFSGMGLRTAFWFCSTVTACIIISHYANKVKAHPEKSFTYGIDTTGLGFTKAFSDCKITKRHVGVLLCLAGIFAFTIVGCTQWGWYLDEMTAVFIIGGIIAGFVAGFNVEKITDCFMKGASNLVFGAMCVGVARGIQVVLENGKIADTIINAVSAPLAGLPTVVGAILMTIAHGIINFLIPSGSGQAAATMPIMFPIGDLIGMTKQTSILAFQIGDGVTNIIYPTLGSLMAVCALARVPFEKWFKFAIRLVAGVYVVGWIFLAIAVAINWGPF